MRSSFWTFVEGCDEARTVRAVRNLLVSAAHATGFETFVITTHAPRRDLRSFNVLLHNWPQEAIDHLNGRRLDRKRNPIFETAERTDRAFSWSSEEWRASLRKEQCAWLDKLINLAGGSGVSKAMQSSVVATSCSAIPRGEPTPEQLRAWMRTANYAVRHVQILQRPHVDEHEKLTAREYECLYRAIVHGERPGAVAHRLGVKVSTVRTLRQKAYGRLDADSPEQAVWRMMETGQLFKNGRTSKPRRR